MESHYINTLCREQYLSGPAAAGRAHLARRGDGRRAAEAAREELAEPQRPVLLKILGVRVGILGGLGVCGAPHPPVPTAHLAVPAPPAVPPTVTAAATRHVVHGSGVGCNERPGSARQSRQGGGGGNCNTGVLCCKAPQGTREFGFSDWRPTTVFEGTFETVFLTLGPTPHSEG